MFAMRCSFIASRSLSLQDDGVRSFG